MGPTYAGVLGPLAFVLVLMRGLIDGSSAESVLCMAAMCLLAFSAIGYITGRIADRILWDSLKSQISDELQMRGSQTPASGEKTS